MKTLKITVQLFTFMLLFGMILLSSCTKDSPAATESMEVRVDESLDNIKMFDSPPDAILDLVITAPKNLDEDQADEWAEALTIDDILQLDQDQNKTSSEENSNKLEYRQLGCGSWVYTNETAISVNCSTCYERGRPAKTSRVYKYYEQRRYCSGGYYQYRWIYVYSYCYNWYGC